MSIVQIDGCRMARQCAMELRAVLDRYKISGNEDSGYIDVAETAAVERYNDHQHLITRPRYSEISERAWIGTY